MNPEYIPTYNMFTRHERACRELELAEVVTIYKDYAFTYNIHKNEYINKKRWNDYSYDKQCQILFKIVSAGFKDLDISHAMQNCYFEETPDDQNAHIHSVITSSRPSQEIEDYFNSKRKCPKHIGKPHKTCYIVTEYNHPGWFLYQTKDPTNHNL
jgi:hypothetical protein